MWKQRSKLKCQQTRLQTLKVYFVNMRIYSCNSVILHTRCAIYTLFINHINLVNKDFSRCFYNYGTYTLFTTPQKRKQDILTWVTTCNCLQTLLFTLQCWSYFQCQIESYVNITQCSSNGDAPKPCFITLCIKKKFIKRWPKTAEATNAHLKQAQWPLNEANRGVPHSLFIYTNNYYRYKYIITIIITVIIITFVL